MSYFEKVLARISPLGLVLLVAGALLSFLAASVAKKIFKEQAEKWVLPIKLTGLVVAVIAVLITLKLV